MATNRHAMIRYRTIDRCLTRRSQRYWTWQELSKACLEELEEFEGHDRPAPARDTIKKDIQTMRSGALGYQAPIRWYPGEGGYAYSDPAFSITQMPLSTADVEALREAMSLLRQFRGFPQVKGVEQVVTKVAEALRMRPPTQRTVLQLEDNMVGLGLEWLDLLYRACRDQRCLVLDYRPFKVPEGYQFRRVISPHLVKEYNNRWFLFAHDHEAHGMQTFAFDRIQQADVYLLADFKENYSFSAEQFFEGLIGVSVPKGGQEEEVVLRASPERARYIETKPLHHSQRIRSTNENGEVTFAYRLVHNVELENQLLSFGETAEVLAPDSLRQAIAKRAVALYRQYTSE